MGAEEIGVASYSLACLWGVGVRHRCEPWSSMQRGAEEGNSRTGCSRGVLCAKSHEPRAARFFGAARKTARRTAVMDHKRPEALYRRGRGGDGFMVYAVTILPTRLTKRVSGFMVPGTKAFERKYATASWGCAGGGAGRVILNDVRVPRALRTDGINGRFPYSRPTAPGGLGTAAMTIGSVRTAVEIATRSTSMRKAFGNHNVITSGVGTAWGTAFRSSTSAIDRLPRPRARSIPAGWHPGRLRRMVGEQEIHHRGSWEMAINCMQEMGGSAIPTSINRAHRAATSGFHDMGGPPRDHASFTTDRLVHGIPQGASRKKSAT